jgi:hypothetical protein
MMKLKILPVFWNIDLGVSNLKMTKNDLFNI